LPVPAHERAEDLRRELAQQVLGTTIGDHSSGAVHHLTDLDDSAYATMRPAISIARASLSTSMIQ
jgi:hypothetical protein